jgi:hypothetical protein
VNLSHTRALVIVCPRAAVEPGGQLLHPEIVLRCARALHHDGSKKGAALGRCKMIVDGIMVPVLALAVLAGLWIVVLYGSTFFGPKTD